MSYDTFKVINPNTKNNDDLNKEQIIIFQKHIVYQDNEIK